MLDDFEQPALTLGGIEVVEHEAADLAMDLGCCFIVDERARGLPDAVVREAEGHAVATST